MGRAKFEVSTLLLQEVLLLPADAHIVGITQFVQDALNHKLTIWVEHKDIPETVPGNDYPWCRPTITVKVDKRGHRTTVFEGWGID